MEYVAAVIGGFNLLMWGAALMEWRMIRKRLGKIELALARSGINGGD